MNEKEFEIGVDLIDVVKTKGGFAGYAQTPWSISVVEFDENGYEKSGAVAPLTWLDMLYAKENGNDSKK